MYFQFWQRNRCHVGILLPVSILTMYHQLHVILLWPTKFHRNWTIYGWAMTSYRFSRWRPRRRKSTSGFLFADVSHIDGQRLSVHQISPIYLNPWLRYYYFRDLETNGCCLENLHLLSIWPFHHVALRWPTKLRPNGTIGDGFMTSYRPHKSMKVKTVKIYRNTKAQKIYNTKRN